jgi:hypothetical protein
VFISVPQWNTNIAYWVREHSIERKVVVAVKPWTYPECNKDEKRAAETDVPYRTCYRACAGGPFTILPNSETLEVRNLQSKKTQVIAAWDNDGIVNTASMLWPNGEKTLLVDADHMDIVGHYKRVAASEGSSREFLLTIF